MKIITLASFFYLTCIVVSSCSKVADNKPVTQASGNTSSAISSVCRSRWVGQFDEQNSGRTIYYADRRFIYDGYAHVLPPVKHNYGFFTNINLQKPECTEVNADSLRMVVSLKNPQDSPYASASYDVDLFVYGTLDTAHVTFVADQQQYTSLGVGKYQISNSPGLLQYFNNYQVVSLEAKNHILSASINGVLRASINYSGTNIGDLQKVLIGFKGSGYVNYVRLYNSTSGVQEMNEDFSTPEKSTDTWLQY